MTVTTATTRRRLMPTTTVRWLSSILLLAMINGAIQPVSATHIIVNLPAGEEDCYMMRVPFHSTLRASYNILEDHLTAEQVAVLLTDEAGKVLYRSRYGKDHGSFEVSQVETKRFQVCVQNAVKVKRRKFDDLYRHVGLNIQVDPPSSEHFDDKTNDLMTYSQKVYAAVSDLKGHFEFRKFRESKHRQIVEAIFSDLLLWTLAQASFVALLALAQVFYLKRSVSKTIV